jgi:hypothetical protein
MNSICLSMRSSSDVGFSQSMQSWADAPVLQSHDDLLERPLLARGVHLHRHGRAAAQRHQQQFIGAGSGIAAAHSLGLVCDQAMAAVEQHLLEWSAARGRNDDGAGRYCGLQGRRIAPGLGAHARPPTWNGTSLAPNASV